MKALKPLAIGLAFPIAVLPGLLTLVGLFAGLVDEWTHPYVDLDHEVR